VTDFAITYRKIEKANQRIHSKHERTVINMVKLNKVDEQVVAALKEGKELTLQELAEKTGQPSKKVFKSLRKLFENEMVDTKARKYRLLNVDATQSKTNSEEEIPEE